MHQIRATNLEKYRTCPYSYFFNPPREGENINFRFGTALHKYIETALQWCLTDEAKDILLKPWAVKYRLMIMAMCNIFLQNVEDRELTYVLSEVELEKVYEEEQIILTGTPDLIFLKKEWDYIMVDIKTAASKRDDEHSEAVKQKLIYPRLIRHQYWIDMKAFEYRPMTKTSSPKLQEIVCEVPNDCDEQVDNKVKELRKSLDRWSFPPNMPNYSCWRCKLKPSCRKYENF